MKLSRDPLLRRSVCAAGQPACSQVRRRVRLSASGRDFPALTGRSGTQRARRQWSAATASTLAPWCSSSSGELRITRVFSCVAHRFKARPSFMFAGCCWWRSLAVDGSSGASRGHAHNAKAEVLGGPARSTTVRFSGRPIPQSPCNVGVCRGAARPLTLAISRGWEGGYPRRAGDDGPRPARAGSHGTPGRFTCVHMIMV